MEAGMSELRPDTLAVRGGLARSAFDETSEGLFLTSGYVYASAQEAEAAFKDVIVYSATKHIDGQGRTLGGAILGTSEFIDGPVKNLMRHIGPSMSPFNAWVLLKGLETLSLRVDRMSTSALELARALEAHPKVSRVIYPWLESHPQHDLARAQMYGGGTVVTFEVSGGKDEAFAVMNALEIVDISNNLGDAKSMITHPATTTHRRLGQQARAAVGITDGVLRVSVGLEDVRDLVEDFERALG